MNGDFLEAPRLSTGQPTKIYSVDGGVTCTASRLGLEDVTLSVDPTKGPIPDEELQRGFGINAVAIDPGDSHHLFAGTVHGVYASTDGGATWERHPMIDSFVTELVFAANAGRLLIQAESSVGNVPLAP